MLVPVVENKDRRRGRRKLTARQKAAGFGGRAAMRSGRLRRRTRRNPPLATISNRSQRRSSRRSYSRRRRSPSRSFLGGIGSMLRLDMALSVAGGIFVGRFLPGWLAKVWPQVPQTGLAATAIRLGGVIGAGYVTSRVLRQPKLASGIVIGGVALVMFELAAQYVLPAVGLTGYTNRYVTRKELEDLGLRGYRVPQRDPSLAGYQLRSTMVDRVMQA